jgi:hypothetical protein
MARVLNRAIWLILGLSAAAVLAGCSSASVIDQIPTSVGGEPTGTPARPTTAYEYPAVHDMPPPRATEAMTEEQEYKAEKDLAAARDQQEAQTAADQPEEAKPATAKKPAAAQKRPANAQDGAKTKP